MKEEGDHREGPDEEAPLRAGTKKRYGDRPGRGKCGVPRTGSGEKES